MVSGASQLTKKVLLEGLKLKDRIERIDRCGSRIHRSIKAGIFLSGREILESKAAASVQLIFPLPVSASAKRKFTGG